MHIVHFSDLHLGREIAEYVPPEFGGLAQAEYDALSQLTRSGKRRAIARMLTTPVSGTPVCVVSGDLSASGHGQELVNAFTFLRSQLVPVFGAPAVGLQYKTSLNPILGNHDIWGGQSPLLAWMSSDRKKARAAGLLGQFQGMAPWRINARRVQFHFDVGLVRVRGYLLDSTHPGLSNVFARGRVAVRDLDRLKRQVLCDADEDRADPTVVYTIRVAVMHHPILCDNHYRLTMVLENADAVLGALCELRFGLVLAGHVHRWGIKELVPGLFQCTCGSSCQTLRDRHSELSFLGYEILAGRGGKGSRSVRIVPFLRKGYQGQPFTPGTPELLDVTTA